MPEDAEMAAEGFAVIRDALRKSKKIGLGQMAARGHDYVVAVKSCGEGLLIETLRFAEEVRASDRIFAGIPEVGADKDMLGACRRIDRTEIETL